LIVLEDRVADLKSLAKILKNMGETRRSTGKRVRGMIIASCVSPDLDNALAAVYNVTFQNYSDLEIY